MLVLPMLTDVWIRSLLLKFSCSIDVQNQSHTLSSMNYYIPKFSSQPTKLQTTQLLPLIIVLTVEWIPLTNNNNKFFNMFFRSSYRRMNSSSSRCTFNWFIKTEWRKFSCPLCLMALHRCICTFLGWSRSLVRLTLTLDVFFEFHFDCKYSVYLLK